ncbi:MAG: hypothetical protein Q8L04_00895 [Ignavibacteria bacterium]|nr:hypothetical protein [Ignavibacteria bacterium]
MIEQQTLFILGAGASNCYVYPTGNKLNEDLIKRLPNELDRLASRTERYFYEEKELVRFSEVYSESHPTLVDYFLAKTPIQKWKEIGKYGITLSLIEAEMKYANSSKFSYYDKDWFSILFDRMTSSILDYNEVARFKENQVSFITFNYDRSLEILFYETLKSNYNLEDSKIHDLVANISIFHTFGKMPLLRYEDPSKHISHNYGDDITEQLITQTMKSILTIHERQGELEIITREISKAKRIFFLGFGFADENIKLLNLFNNIHSNRIQILATSIGLKQQQTDRITKNMFPSVSKMVNNEKIRFPLPEFHQISCKELLSFYL